MTAQNEKTDPIRIKPIKLLIIEGDQDKEGFSLLPIINDSQSVQIVPTHANQLSSALNTLRNSSFDAILMNLTLPDSLGMDTFLQINSQAPDTPVVVISGGDQRDMALEVIREGAQDFLIEGDFDAERLVRSIRFAIERNRMRAMLQYLSLNDELTGLLNRRGFISLANQQVKIARREKWQLLLIFADLDGLKNINDRLGHPTGDQALRSMALVFKETFRTSDVIARLGGDEFIILANNFSNEGMEGITGRLQDNINKANAKNQEFKISVSYGIVQFDPQSGETLDEMIAKADQALYLHKLSKGEE
jgi:two-component system cell cycle response regulator